MSTLHLSWRDADLNLRAPGLVAAPLSAPVASNAPTGLVAPTSSARRARRRQELDDVERIATRMATLAAMQETWPLVFDLDMPVPLEIGIHEQVRDALGISDVATNDAMRWWCSRAAYRAPRMAGGPRYGLDAEPAGDVSDEHRDHAVKTPASSSPSASPGES